MHLTWLKIIILEEGLWNHASEMSRAAFILVFILHSTSCPLLFFCHSGPLGRKTGRPWTRTGERVRGLATLKLRELRRVTSSDCWGSGHYLCMRKEWECRESKRRERNKGIIFRQYLFFPTCPLKGELLLQRLLLHLCERWSWSALLRSLGPYLGIYQRV